MAVFVLSCESAFGGKTEGSEKLQDTVNIAGRWLAPAHWLRHPPCVTSERNRGQQNLQGCNRESILRWVHHNVQGAHWSQVIHRSVEIRRLERGVPRAIQRAYHLDCSGPQT